MTLGQRIQELRRGRGLSQEGLGDLLGVSRQAISKWESDITIPEVDKLIAISRRFDISVGYLLGVEEACTTAPEQEVSQELTERELAAVEAIVNRYLEQLEQTRPKPQPEKQPRRWKWAAAVLAVLLVLSWLSVSKLNKRIDDLSGQTQTVQNQVMGVEHSVTNQINSLTGRLEKLLEAQNHLLGEWDCRLIDYIPGEKGIFSMSAKPKEYVPGMTAVFCAENNEGEQVSVPAEWNGVAYTARMDVPLWDAPKFSIELDDGQSRKTQPMETSQVYMLKSHFGLGVPSMGTMGAGKLTRKGELILDMEVDFELEALTPGDFNRELDVEPWWVAMEGAGRWRADVSGSYQVQGEEKLEVEVLVTDNFGQQTRWPFPVYTLEYE